jgi:hypothetical protein
MGERFYSELIDVVRSFDILSPSAFVFRGERVDCGTGGDLLQAQGHPLPAAPLDRFIQATLYTRCYARRLGEDDVVTEDAGRDASAFVQALSSKNATRDRWNAGWTVIGLGTDGSATLRKADSHRVAVPGEYATEGPPGVAPSLNSPVSVQVRREALNAQPGLYFAYSETPSDTWDQYHLLRFYFNVRSDAAESLIGYVTRALNRFQVPYSLKAPASPEGYWRTDAVVLYLASRYYRLTARIIAGIPDDIVRGLRKPVPLYSKPVAPGVGLAEEPNTGESFGMHRCRLTAEGLVDAWRAGDRGEDAKIRAVGIRFALNNLVLSRPHLSLSKDDPYEVASSS